MNSIEEEDELRQFNKRMVFIFNTLLGDAHNTDNAVAPADVPHDAQHHRAHSGLRNLSEG